MKFFSPGFLLLWSCVAMSAATLEIAPDADTTIFTAGINGGSASGPEFVAGVNPHAAFARAPLHFNVSSIPSNAVIDSATMTLTVTRKSSQSPGGDSFDLCRITRAWNEAQATWTTATSGSLWTSGGGDFVATPSASMFCDIGSSSFTSDGLAADVQAWVSGSKLNAGWMLRTSDESIQTSARRFASREAFDPPTRPKLTVLYHIPPPPVTMTGTRQSGNLLQFDFQAAVGFVYAVEFETQFDNSWQPLTNITVGAPSLVNVFDAVTNSPQRIYRVNVISPP